MKPTPAELALLRTRPQQVDTKLVIYKPPTIFACRVNDTTIQKTALSIIYDTVSTGAYTDIKAGMTMYVGTALGKADVGRVRVKSATATVLSVAENGLDWADNLYLTVVNFYELWPKSSLDVQDGKNILHYIDYDVPYGSQNTVMGTFICAGPPGVCEAGQSIYWGSSGTKNTEDAAIEYTWSFGGGSPSTGTVADPGYVQYGTPGYYMTEISVYTTGTGYSDTTYRPVIVLGGSVQPYTQWGFDSIDGSRDEGGWTAKLWLREENMPEVMDGSLCIIYQDCYYGSTKQDIGGNAPGRQKVLFVGYILDNSIKYDWKSSKMEFAISSPTGRMKLLEGLSVSMDNVASAPTAWQQVKNLTGKKALYYYLKWHTTVLNCCDVHWEITPDPEIPSWDSEISSVYDIVQKFADIYYLGEAVSDRQGAIWIEKHPKSIHAITGTFNTVLDIDRQDWMGEIDITEQLNSPVSYLEMHGLSYAGIVSGTVGDYLSGAPYINKRNPFGTADFIQGYVVGNQTENNQIVGDVFAHKNARFPSVNISLAGWYSLFDIAPEECVTLTTVQQDTARGIIWNRKSFLLREMSIERDAQNKILLPTINLYETTQGTSGATVPIPTPVQPPTYPEFPPITGGWTDVPWPFDWPKPWVEPPPGDNCRGNIYATYNGPYALSFDKNKFSSAESSIALFPCYIRAANARNPTIIKLFGIIYDNAASWNAITVEAIDSGQDVVATAICTEDHGFPGANGYGVYQFSLADGIDVAGFKITVPTASGQPQYSLGSFISSAVAQGTDDVGVTIGGLTIGNYYALESAQGPFYYRGPTHPGEWSYKCEIFIGGAWTPLPGRNYVGYVEQSAGGSILHVDNYVNSNYGRVYFQASGTSIKFRCSDSLYSDNSGYLTAYLYVGIVVNSVMDLSGAFIENVCI